MEAATLSGRFQYVVCVAAEIAKVLPFEVTDPRDVLEIIASSTRHVPQLYILGT